MIFGTQTLHAFDAPSFSADGKEYVWGGQGVLRLLSTVELTEGYVPESFTAVRQAERSPTDPPQLERIQVELEGLVTLPLPRSASMFRIWSSLFDGSRWHAWTAASVLQDSVLQ